MESKPSSEIRKLACDLITKAFENHKIHARFAETQRSWMVTAYFTFTGFVILRFSSDTDPKSLIAFQDVVLVHLLVSILFMISVSKLSGEFRRHFTRAEKILYDVNVACVGDKELELIFHNAILETAAIKENWKGKRIGIVLFSNALVHAYMFSLLSACDLYILATNLDDLGILSNWSFAVAFWWLVLASILQSRYINKVERTGTEVHYITSVGHRLTARAR